MKKGNTVVLLLVWVISIAVLFLVTIARIREDGENKFEMMSDALYGIFISALITLGFLIFMTLCFVVSLSWARLVRHETLTLKAWIKRDYSAQILMGIMLIIVLLIAVPSVVKSRMLPSESSPISSLRTLCSVQEQYRQTMTGGKRYCNSLAMLSSLEYIDGVLGVGRKSGYTFTLRTEAISSDGYIDLWNCEARPVKYDKTGRCYFFVNETGVLRFNTTGPATANSPPVD